MDDLTRELFNGQKRRMDVSELEGIGKRASRSYLRGEDSIAGAIVKIAEEYPGLTDAHLHRIVEFANTATFTDMFDKTAGDKNIEFDLADYEDVARRVHTVKVASATMKVASHPTHDYALDATKLGSDRSVEKDVRIAQMFGYPVDTPAMQKTAGHTNVDDAVKYMRKQAEHAGLVEMDLSQAVSLSEIKKHASKVGQYAYENPNAELVAFHQQLTKVAEDASAMRDRNRQMAKEAAGYLSGAVKQHMLNGGNLGEVIDVMGYVDDSGVRVKEAMTMVIPELKRHGLDVTEAQTDTIFYDMTKAAMTRVVNPDNPIVQSFSAFVKAAEKGAILDEAVNISEENLAKARKALATR